MDHFTAAFYSLPRSSLSHTPTLSRAPFLTNVPTSGWWLYDDLTNEQLEEYYKDYEEGKTDDQYYIMIGAEKYLIDFTNGFQMNAVNNKRR